MRPSCSSPRLRRRRRQNGTTVAVGTAATIYNGGWGYGGWGPWVGLGAGIVVASLLTRPYYGYYPRPYRYQAAYGNRDAYCHLRFRSYNSHTRTYTGYDGRQHRCY